jgi:cytochrome P450
MSDGLESAMAVAAARRERAVASGCPVVHFDYTTERPALTYFNRFDELRANGAVAYSDYGPGFWMLLTSELVREAYQTPEVFSSSATIPTVPDPQWQWIPTMIDPPEHADYRRILNLAFSPRFVRQLEPTIRRDCIATIEEFRGDGRVDFMKEFAKVFPTTVFLRILGLPVEDTERFMDWVERIFEGLGHFGDEAEDQLRCQREIQSYFARVLVDRRGNPRPEEDGDFFTILATSKLRDRLLTEQEFLNIAEVILLAGLDTVSKQLSYAFHHLAITPSDREWIVRDPAIVENAVEEFLRAHNIVMTARQVAVDIDFHGCPMRKGDMVMVANPSGSRDEAEYDEPTTIQLDRKVTRHYSFAGGPHRCVGAHLARTELAVALQEWHRLIPDYRLDDADGLVESGPMIGLSRLRLAWDRA